MPTESRPRVVIYYATQQGHEPFLEWLESISVPFQDRALRRLQRVQLGNFGDHKRIGEGILELRLHFGKGYRIYFAEDGDSIVVLLTGGSKNTQSKDIKEAKMYWKNYLRHKES